MLPALLWLSSLLALYFGLRLYARHMDTHQAMSQAATWALGLGAGAALLSVVVEAVLLPLQGFVFSLFRQFGHFAAWEEELRIIWLSFTAVALWEESAKFLVLWALSKPLRVQRKNTAAPSRARRNRQFLLLLGLNLALGFSAAENLWYMLRYDSESIYRRLFGPTLVHFCLAVLLSLRLADIAENPRKTMQCLGVLIGPVVWHGAYNSALAIGKAGWIVIAILLLYSSAKLVANLALPP